MDLYDWLLFLHVLAAFAIVGGVVVLGALMVAARGARGGGRDGVLRLSPLARRLWDVGGLGTLVLGVWLALHVDGYSLTDGWILAALVLWVVAAVSGARLGADYVARLAGEPPAAPARTRLLYAISALAVLALVVDMIFKPGA